MDNRTTLRGENMYKIKSALPIKAILLISFSIILATVFTFTSFASSDLPSAAEYNQEVDNYLAKLESDFNIKIEYEYRPDGYAIIGIPSLITLEDSLNYLSKPFVQQLSAYYAANYAGPLKFVFSYSPSDKSKIDVAALSYFSSKTSTITLYVPSPNSGSTVSGCGPFSIIHEMGHAYHVMLSNHYGYNNLKNYWGEYNKGYNYSEKYTQNPDRTTFASLYATINYEEDFAETFSYAFTCNRPGLGLGHRMRDKAGVETNLGRKINYLESTLPLFIQNYGTSTTNIRQCSYAPVYKYYEGYPLSGNSLEYVQFNPPHGIYSKVVSKLKLNPVSAEWVWSIGGWKIEDETGGVYIVFPGSEYVTLSIPKRKASR